ncbi:MAG: ATP-binding cassette domain-containing protein, partial [Beijerinckiaceae bacterium]
MTSDLRLSLKDVAVVRGERVLVERLTIACAAGEALVVLGRNGSGKSSLLRSIAGLLRTGAGGIELSPEDDDKPVGQRAHLVTGRDPLKAVETVGETLTAWSRLFGSDTAAAQTGDADCVRQALADWNLDALRDAPCGILSSGQRRRTSLARLSLT